MHSGTQEGIVDNAGERRTKQASSPELWEAGPQAEERWFSLTIHGRTRPDAIISSTPHRQHTDAYPYQKGREQGAPRTEPRPVSRLPVSDGAGSFMKFSHAENCRNKDEPSPLRRQKDRRTRMEVFFMQVGGRRWFLLLRNFLAAQWKCPQPKSGKPFKNDRRLNRSRVRPSDRKYRLRRSLPGPTSFILALDTLWVNGPRHFFLW